MTASDTSIREKDRFVALAFCRADLLFELNDSRMIEFVAGATPVLLGKKPAQMRKTNFLDYIHEDDHLLVDELMDTASNKGRLDDVTLHLKGPKGAKLRIVLSGYRVPDFNNHFFLAIKVEPKKDSFGKINPLRRDQDTDLLDAESFSQAASERISSFIRAGGDAQVSMVKVNQLDKLLQEVDGEDKQKILDEISDLLNENSIGGDTASRIDEDSFSFAHSKEVDADSVNSKIEELAKNIHPAGAMVQAISSTLEVDGADMSEDQVSRAMMHTMQKFCENQGSLREDNISDVLSGMMNNTVKNVDFIKEISRTRDFDIYYMPINDLNRGYVHHFEGLVRFRGEHGGQSPYHMINLAEEVGIISELDMAIVEKCIEEVTRYNKRKAIPPVAVNLSGATVGNEAFMQSLLCLVKEDPSLSKKLLFEITESAKIDDLQKVNNTIQSFRELGFEICLDDFGAGAASFDYLNALDVDVVKFDGPVVKRAYSTDKGHDLLKAMANMCRDLKIETVAEMVEDEQMAYHMKECGIDYGQGWFFGKPDPDPYLYSRKFAPKSKVKKK
ncbi:EAL domain [Candidatus Terasakiella magnetica]|uniref:EAL domain n=1 Tax=Candidatus Terasakiella magnetica TaxID=1867952 RepID=A0A1C3RLF6_9PROT|nr:EAL domain-containing protein [Candidatus Terasakiella magnetica]SCA58150.1 EAL domain [Candidatus Terasakiella magnetica]